MQHGKLYGIGIGPGDPELLTLKGARILAQCDVVFTVILQHGSASVSGAVVEAVRPRGRVERLVFRLRTRDGIDARLRPEWKPTLERFAAEGLLARDGEVFRLTRRGAEVCDAILAELV